MDIDYSFPHVFVFDSARKVTTFKSLYHNLMLAYIKGGCMADRTVGDNSLVIRKMIVGDMFDVGVIASTLLFKINNYSEIRNDTMTYTVSDVFSWAEVEYSGNTLYSISEEWDNARKDFIQALMILSIAYKQVYGLNEKAIGILARHELNHLILSNLLHSDFLFEYVSMRAVYLVAKNCDREILKQYINTNKLHRVAVDIASLILYGHEKKAMVEYFPASIMYDEFV